MDLVTEGRFIDCEICGDYVEFCFYIGICQICVTEEYGKLPSGFGPYRACKLCEEPCIYWHDDKVPDCGRH